MRIDSVSQSGIPITPPTFESKSPKSFGDLLTNAMGQMNHSQNYVENLIERVATGENINPAVVATAVNKTDIAWRTMVQMRNKLVQAFDELRQMQV